jgi:hypothetical protein
MDITLHYGEELARKDVTVQGCKPSVKKLHRLEEPVEKYGRTNKFLVIEDMAIGKSHSLVAEKPDWA